VGLAEELEQVAGGVAALAGEGETVAGVVPVETADGARVYLCAFSAAAGEPTWLVVGPAGVAVTDRNRVREAASLAAICELAEESAAGGDLDDLRAQLVALRLTESPLGIEEAEEAVAELQRVIGAPPQVASSARLDRIGAATRRLEAALGNSTASPFTEAMKRSGDAVQAFVSDVEAGYRVPFVEHTLQSARQAPT
jgi:hypothetical protein